MASLGGSKGLSENVAAAARDAAAASAPWPRASATMMAVSLLRSAILQVSPHSVSPATARQIAPNCGVGLSAADRAQPAGPRLAILDTTTVPSPATE